jgi:hypothetical protein
MRGKAGNQLSDIALRVAGAMVVVIGSDVLLVPRFIVASPSIILAKKGDGLAGSRPHALLRLLDILRDIAHALRDTQMKARDSHLLKPKVRPAEQQLLERL